MPITRPLQPADKSAWIRMRQALWPDIEPHGAEADADEWSARTDATVIVAEDSEHRLIGFAEAGERTYADGCDTSPVAYLEGWYVEPDARGTGVGALLVQAVEAWAKRRGLHELASDALLDNTLSHAAHLGTGFAEVERAVRYRKPLT